MLAYSDKSWVAFTLDHLRYFSQELAIEGTYLPFRYSLYGGGKFMFYRRLRKQKEESVSLASNFLAQDKIKYLDLRTYYTLEPLAFGIWFRGLAVFPKKQNLGALSFLVNYKLGDFKVGYSFDFTISKLITRTGGTREISVIYAINALKRKKFISPFLVPPDKEDRILLLLIRIHITIVRNLYW